MTDIKIPDLPPANDPDGTELYEVVQDNISKKMTGTQQQRQPFPFTAVAGTNYTLQAADLWLRTSNGAAVSILIDSHTNVPIASGRSFQVSQEGAGQVTFVAGAGVTILTPETLKIAKQYAIAVITELAQDIWILGGYLELAP